MRALVIGGGAIGTLAATVLGGAGWEIVALARPATALALSQDGYRLTSPKGDQGVQPALVTGGWGAALETRPDLIVETRPDLIVVAVKSYDTAALLAELRPALGAERPAVLCLQNGVDNEAALAKVFGAEAVIAGTVTTAVGMRGPGWAEVERDRGVGIASGHALSEALAEAFTTAGHRTQLFGSAGSMKWSKLLTNLIGNATSALLDWPVARLLDWPVARIYSRADLYAIERRMLRETLAVMRALGLPVVDLPGVRVRLVPLVLALPAWLGRPLLGRAAGGGRGGKMARRQDALVSRRCLCRQASD